MTASTPSLNQLRRASEIAQQIEQLEAELRSVLAGDSTPTLAGPSPSAVGDEAKAGRSGRRSPEVRARMAAAQRARYAKKTGSDSPAADAPEGAGKAKSPKQKQKSGKRTISPEGRARIAEAARQRWAKQRKGK